MRLGGFSGAQSVDELDAKLMGMIDAARASEAERAVDTGTTDSSR